MTSRRQSKWRGVWSDEQTPAERRVGEQRLNEIRANYCRALTRSELRQEFKIADDDAVGVTGALVKQLYALLESQHLPDFPTLTQLGQACDTEVKLNVLNKFMNGKSTNGTHWLRNAREMLRFLLLGVKPTDAQLAHPTYVEIDDYFFRKIRYGDANRPTPYFRLERARPEAWSRYELAGEVRWVAHQKRLHPEWPAEIVWVSGGSPYFPEGVDRRMGQSTALALETKAPVTFIKHLATDRDAELDAFFDAHMEAKAAEQATEIDLSDPVVQREVPNWFQFAGGYVQYLYLSLTNPADSKEPRDNLKALYLVRPLRTADPDGARRPAVILANDQERAMFEAWLADLRRAADQPAARKTRRVRPAAAR